MRISAQALVVGRGSSRGAPSRFWAGRRLGSRRSFRAAPLLFVLVGQPIAQAAPTFVEAKACRPAEEEGEFLQSCVKLNVGKKAGKVLGPGLVAPGGQAAAVLQHRKYGAATDRVMVRLHGAAGRFEGTYRMGVGGDEFALSWSQAGRFLAWVEVDGRGGQLRVVDRVRRRFALSVLSPIEEWPIFAPLGSRLLLPVGRPGEEVVRELAIIDLLIKGSRQVVLKAGADEELVQPRWLSATTVQATRRTIGTARGKPVQGSFKPPPPPPETEQE